MLQRIARRLQATFRGPSSYELLAKIDALAVQAEEVRALRSEVDRLRAIAEPFHTRPNTLDSHIYSDVLVGNEYALPSHFDSKDVIIDIGAHIGSFSTACLLRGAGRVLAFEPQPANHSLLSVNLSRFGNRAEARCAAVWRSDSPTTQLSYWASDDPTNTGGGGINFGDSPGASFAITAVSLDAIVAELLAATGRSRIRLLKIDCEGSEYPVLLTATCLDRIDEICGEYHTVSAAIPVAQVGGHTEYDSTILVKHLNAAGFEVKTAVNPQSSLLGLFWAKRR